jgi:hypothetical protein
MGGAAGHMRHPFDLNHVKTGDDLIKEFENIKKFVNEKPVAIKIDGTNVSFKITQPTQTGADGSAPKQFAVDRGSTKLIDVEGVTLSNLSDRFPEGHGMRPAITTLLNVFNEALKTTDIQSDLEKLGLWDDPTVFFNTEYVMKTTNVVKYDTNFVAIHGVNQFYEKTNSRTGVRRPGADRPVNPNTGKAIKDPSKEISYDAEALNSLIEKVSPIAKKSGFELFSTIPAKKKEAISINYDAVLSKPFPITISREEGPQHASMRERLTAAVLPPSNLYIPLINGKPIPALGKQVYKMVTGASAKDDSVSTERQVSLLEAFGEDEEIHKLAIDGAVFWHATRLLGNEVLKSLTTDGMGEATDHEGIVLRMGYEGPVKITGDFILGGEASDFKQIAEAIETTTEMGEDQIIVLYPGGFKPPHAGHFELAKRYAEDDAVGKVVMLIGPKERKSKDGSVTITKEDSIHVLNEFYKQYLGDKVVIEDSPDGEENPMRAAFKWIEEKAGQGETYTLAASSKDSGRAESFADSHCHPHGKYCRSGIDVVTHTVDTEAVTYEEREDDNNGENISASIMREDLAAGDKENFETSLPKEVRDYADEIFDFLGGVKKTEDSPSPSSSDDDPIEEISSMAGGAVEGSAAARGGAWQSFSRKENEQHRRSTKLNENKQDSETNYKYISADRKKNMSVKELLQEKQKIEELALRRHIRHLLNKKYGTINEEKKLRLIIKNLIKEAAIEDTPSRSTGINKLVGALKIILPTIERAYKSLTTSPEQRDSYKRHLVKAIIDTLSPQDAISGVGDGGEEGVEPLPTEEPAGLEPAPAEEPMDAEMPPVPDEEEALEEIPLQEQEDPVAGSPEGIDIEVAGGAGDEDPFRTKEDDEAAAKAAEEEKEADKKRKKEGFKDVEGLEKDFPELSGLDETGRDEAVDIYKKVIDAVIRTYRRLHSDRDKAHFKDYLITNLLLYFDKLYGVETVSTGQGGFFVQGRGQRGSVKTLKQFNCQR